MDFANCAEFIAAFRESPTPVVLTHLVDGTIADVNPAAEKIFDYSRAELLGKAPLTLGLWGDTATRARMLSHLRLKRTVDREPITFHDRSGRTFAAQYSAELVQVRDTQYVLSMLREIAGETTPAEDVAQRELVSYRSLFIAAAEGIYRSAPEGGFIDVNPAMARIFGFDTPEQMLATVRNDASSWYADAEQAKRAVHLLQRDGRISDLRSQIRRRDGSTAWISENSRTVLDAEKRILFYEGTVVDISERLAAEAALKQSEALYKTLVDNLLDGVFLLQHGRLLFANKALQDILGFESAELMGQDYMAIVAPQWRDEQLQRRNERESGSRNVFAHELGVHRKDGREVMLSIRSAPVEYAGAIASTGTIRDITEERRQQRAIVEAERKFRELFENSPVGLYQSHPDGSVLECNPVLAQMLGYESPAQVMAEVQHMVDVYADSTERPRLIAAIMQRGRIDHYETQVRCRDGRLIWVETNIRAIRDAQGRTLHFEGSVQDITARRAAEAALERNATHDALTGLANRQRFARKLEEAMAAGTDYAVLYLDLDGFKVVNDSLGHAAGDRLLQQIGARLSEGLKQDMLIARHGGDEFTLLLHGPAPSASATHAAERVLELLGEPFDVDGHPVFTMASVGVVLGNPEYANADQVIRDADTAMYRAKAAGKASFMLFDEAMHDDARARLKLETDLRLALARDEFRLYYQPIVCLKTGTVRACEALLRWQHPTRGLLLPEHFLQVAEETGLIMAIDWWVLEQACKTAVGWRGRGADGPKLRLNVNLDDRQFSHRRLVPAVAEILHRTGIDPTALCLEITEGVFRTGRREAGLILHALKSLGVALVVDDFGTGYSSLDSFTAAPFDALKIDRGFVLDMESNRRHLAIVRTIARFAEDLGLGLTAEGVETEAQAQLVAALGCDQAQGFLYSPAIPADQFERLLDSGAARFGGSRR